MQRNSPLAPALLPQPGLRLQSHHRGQERHNAPHTLSPRPWVQDTFSPGLPEPNSPSAAQKWQVATSHVVSMEEESQPPSLHVKDWPTEPRELGNPGKSTLIWRLIDMILSIVPLLIIIMAILATLADGKPVLEHPGYRTIIDVTSIVSSSCSSMRAALLAA